MIDFFNYAINGILQGQLYALISLGFVVIYRASKVFNFAQGELMLLGAYAVWTLMLGAGLSPWLAIPLAFLCAASYGWLIERLFFHRLVGESVFSMVMVTIGLVILIRGIVLVIWGAADRSFPAIIPIMPILVGEIILPTALVVGAVLTLLFTLGLSYFFNRTRHGLALSAVAEEPSIALSLGISVKRAVTLAWMIGSSIATVGAIILLSGRSLTVMSADVALSALPVALLAGLESIGGLILAGAIVGVVQSLVAAYVDPVLGGAASSIVPFVFMLLILLIRPTGLFGWRHVERV
jgi:branched-chain amino acid transport system permease protein